MKLPFLVAAILAASPLVVGDSAHRGRTTPRDGSNLESLARGSVEPSATPVVAGSSAPNFSYQSHDNTWRTLNDLLEQGAVLLVFAPREMHLDAIERERESLLALGVIPVAVVDRNPRETRALASAHGLHYTVIPDARGVIASQFNALAPATLRSAPCWFVVDRKGRVRALDRKGLPEKGYTDIAAGALNLAKPGVSVPTRR